MPKNSRLAFGLICLSLTACNDNIIDLDGEQLASVYQDNIIDLNGEQLVSVYQDDQAISCENTGTISVKTHGKLLIDENVELHCSQKGHDGMGYTQACGSQTGTINIFTIHDKDLATAESLGFSELSTLPDAQFDAQCEFNVISDTRKNDLLNQLNDQYVIWQANNTSNYQFQFNMSFSDCPTFAPTPIVTISVIDNAINTVYDIDDETFLSNITDYKTIDELYSELDLKLKLMPIEAGFNANKPFESPVFSSMGIPEQYFINAGGEECDAANYTMSDLVLL